MSEGADGTSEGILCFHGSLRAKGAKSELGEKEKEIPEGRGGLNYRNSAKCAFFEGSASQGMNQASNGVRNKLS